jgi:universal stress protein E
VADPSIILAATDRTAVGDRVIELAATVAHAFGAELHIVHAYSISLEAQLEGGEARAEYERGQHEAAVAHIEKALASTPLAGAAQLHIGPTSPTQAILEGVEYLRPGLVVMGTISRGGIPGLLMGNTAERLVDRIDCALLTLKPNDFVCPVEA